MDYSVYLNLHVTAVIVWVVSMLSISVLISASAGYGPSKSNVGFRRIEWANRFVTTPFMVLAWALGITLAIKGAWFGANWLSAKLIFVFVLSGPMGPRPKHCENCLHRHRPRYRFLRSYSRSSWCFVA
jgi:putative membrane protein